MSDEQKTIKDSVDSAAEIKRMQRQIAEQNSLLAQFAADRADLERQMNGGVLPPEERPIYELTQPFFSPDDVYYAEGFVIEDVRGDITPNEFMIPRNPPAQQRYDEYMASLPVAGRQPTLFEMIDVVSQSMRQLGPTAAGSDINAAVMAMLLQKMAPGHTTQPQAPVPGQTRRNASIPMMANTNITNAGVPTKPPAPKRGPARTRAIGQTPEPTANVQGTVPSQPLSHLPA